jgi:hypothetical protein
VPEPTTACKGIKYEISTGRDAHLLPALLDVERRRVWVGGYEQLPLVREGPLVFRIDLIPKSANTCRLHAYGHSASIYPSRRGQSVPWSRADDARRHQCDVLEHLRHVFADGHTASLEKK